MSAGRRNDGGLCLLHLQVEVKHVDGTFNAKQRDEQLNTSTSQFMKMLPFFNIAANEINDVEFFKKIVRARAQRAAIAFEASHFIRCFWMSWSLWNLSHTERAAVINRRSGLPAFESSSLRKAGYSQYQKPIYSSSSFRPFGFLYSAPRLSEAQRRI